MANASTGSKFSAIKWILVLVVLVVVAVLIQNIVAHRMGATAAPQDAASVKATEDRIKPLGEVAMAPVVRPATAVSATAPTPVAAETFKGAPDAASKVGENTYNATCMGCHSTGALGAPKLGDKAAWVPRIAQGMESLYANALKGYKSMPAKGGNPSLSDADVKATVDYIVAAAK